MGAFTIVPWASHLSVSEIELEQDKTKNVLSKQYKRSRNEPNERNKERMEEIEKKYCALLKHIVVHVLHERDAIRILSRMEKSYRAHYTNNNFVIKTV